MDDESPLEAMAVKNFPAKRTPRFHASAIWSGGHYRDNYFCQFSPIFGDFSQFLAILAKFSQFSANINGVFLEKQCYDPFFA
jgi:hypothetical protein